jgi:hypothetical protein
VFIKLQVLRGRDTLFTRFRGLSYFVPCPLIANSLLKFLEINLNFGPFQYLCIMLRLHSSSPDSLVKFR